MTLVRLLLFLGFVLASVAAPHGVDLTDGGAHAEQVEMACPDCLEAHGAPPHGARSCDVSGLCVGPWLQREEPIPAAHVQRVTVLRVSSNVMSPSGRPETETPPPRRC